MNMTTYHYPILIKKAYLDIFGHVNNAKYLTLFEEARWDFITKNGFGIKKMKEEGTGPTILEINIRYLKELCLGDKVIIETQLLSYEGKIGKIKQRMLRGEEVCCVAHFTIGLLNLKKRKLIIPSAEWLQAFGMTH